MHTCRILLNRTEIAEEHPCHSLLPIEFGKDDVEVRILTCSMMDNGTGYSMIQLDDPNGIVEEGRFVYPGGESTVARVSRNKCMAMVTNRRCMLSSLINRSGCFLSSAVPKTDTLIEWTLIGPSSAEIQNLLEDMRAHGYSFEIISSKVASPDVTLTPKQEAYFETAMDLGYYDVPKRIGLDELSKILGCSKSNLNVILRTAERNIFDFYRMFCRSERFVKK